MVTFVDSDGYPSSFRCVPVVGVGGELSFAAPRSLRVIPGPAGLLCHFHDEGLWNQRSFVAKGELKVSDNDIIFTPTSFVEGLAKGRRMIGLLTTGRRRAHQYLQRRGLPRPEVPWGELRAIRKTVFPTRPQPVLYLSAAYLVVAAFGTWLATASDLPAQALGLRSGLPVLRDFFVGFGTALSAPFALLVVLVALNVALWAGQTSRHRHLSARDRFCGWNAGRAHLLGVPIANNHWADTRSNRCQRRHPAVVSQSRMVFAIGSLT